MVFIIAVYYLIEYGMGVTKAHIAFLHVKEYFYIIKYTEYLMLFYCFFERKKISLLEFLGTKGHCFYIFWFVSLISFPLNLHYIKNKI